MSKNFDPYPDFDKLTQKQAARLAQAVGAYRSAGAVLTAEKTPERAAEFMRAHHDVGEIHDEILEEIWTVPMMIHVAAEREYEDIEGESVLTQRCSRCKSILHFVKEGMVAFTEEGPVALTEENVPWWEAGQRVAKSTRQDGMTMYEVEPERELEKHELECVGLPNMEG